MRRVRCRPFPTPRKDVGLLRINIAYRLLFEDFCKFLVLDSFLYKLISSTSRLSIMKIRKQGPYVRVNTEIKDKDVV